jgi:hypothetical protein
MNRNVRILLAECLANGFALPLDPLTNYVPGGGKRTAWGQLEGNWLYGITCEIDDFEWLGDFGYAHIHWQS